MTFSARAGHLSLARVGNAESIVGIEDPAHGMVTDRSGNPIVIDHAVGAMIGLGGDNEDIEEPTSLRACNGAAPML